MKEGGRNTFHLHPCLHTGTVRPGSSKRWSRSGAQPARPCLKHPTDAVYYTGPVKGNLYLLHFTNEETKTQRGEGIFLGSHRD